MVYPRKEDTARLRSLVQPEDAAIFMNDVFVGHVDRFNGSSGMRVSAGTYSFTVALPGYESFETDLTVRTGQTYEIKTYLKKGSVEAQVQVLSTGQ
jgi:hypothetical protein